MGADAGSGGGDSFGGDPDEGESIGGGGLGSVAGSHGVGAGASNAAAGEGPGSGDEGPGGGVAGGIGSLGFGITGLSPEAISFSMAPAQQPGLMQGLLGLFGSRTDVLGNTPGFAGGTVGSLSKAANSISDPATAAEVAAAQAAMAGTGPDANGGGDGFDLPTTSGLLRLASALGSSPAIPNATSGILSRPQYQFMPNRWEGNRFVIPSLTPIV